MYQTLGCDCFGVERDAWSFPADDERAVIAHPPCRLWGRLAKFVELDLVEAQEERQLGLFCARVVRRNGGVLEHPAYSGLWREASLPGPGEAGEGFTVEVPQLWFGHRARKLTWLWVNGLGSQRDLPQMPFALERWAGGGNGRRGSATVALQCRQERERTPLALATWLIEVAERISQRSGSTLPSSSGSRLGGPLGVVANKQPKVTQ